MPSFDKTHLPLCSLHSNLYKRLLYTPLESQTCRSHYALASTHSPIRHQYERFDVTAYEGLSTFIKVIISTHQTCSLHVC
jgi:hypothetical protein